MLVLLNNPLHQGPWRELLMFSLKNTGVCDLLLPPVVSLCHWCVCRWLILNRWSHKTTCMNLEWRLGCFKNYCVQSGDRLRFLSFKCISVTLTDHKRQQKTASSSALCKKMVNILCGPCCTWLSVVGFFSTTLSWFKICLAAKWRYKPQIQDFCIYWNCLFLNKTHCFNTNINNLC